ncbi:AAA family ATPase [uncultured Anaerococcus sp.]|uniref:ATP-binding protein n=1 Tax=uncultured Anaerococcus sp. TaxID=293428 RepID=UPI0028892CED|nr:AAA family ATPase [uncultured Anaerococcus sp.]
MLFKRKIYEKLIDWKNESKGETALLIEGARRIGKSTVAEEFAKNEYRSYILIDFAFAPKLVQELFEDVSDLNYIFLQLQLHYAVTLHERESLIIFDEVQFNPLARQAIKRLVADGRYDYLETGSLISIKKNVKDILIPSEERRIEMVPMDFEEFLWAKGDYNTVPLLRSAFDKKVSLGDDLNRKMMRVFREYMLVGGMPQAVSTYIDTNNLMMVDRVKRDIIDLYEQDFYKIDRTGRVSNMFDSIPAELSRNSSRYQVSSVLKNDRASTVMEEIAELSASKTVLKANHANDPNIGLATNINPEKFKLYLADTGLLVSLMFKDKDFTENIIYSKFLSNKLHKNLGILYENVVCQTFASRGYKLFYYSYRDEIASRRFEIDFILNDLSKISPVEVKSASYRKHRSLDEFSIKYSDKIKDKYVIHTKDFKFENGVYYLPFYMAQFL